jgi:cytochrome c-type biogenesis protein CcmE
MNQEKRLALLVTLVFGLGILSGLLIGAVRQHQTRHVDPEYFIELKGNSAIIEGLDRHTYFCPIDSIPAVLLRDNL